MAITPDQILTLQQRIGGIGGDGLLSEPNLSGIIQRTQEVLSALLNCINLLSQQNTNQALRIGGSGPITEVLASAGTGAPVQVPLSNIQLFGSTGTDIVEVGGRAKVTFGFVVDNTTGGGLSPTYILNFGAPPSISGVGVLSNFGVTIPAGATQNVSLEVEYARLSLTSIVTLSANVIIEGVPVLGASSFGVPTVIPSGSQAGLVQSSPVGLDILTGYGQVAITQPNPLLV